MTLSFIGDLSFYKKLANLYFFYWHVKSDGNAFVFCEKLALVCFFYACLKFVKGVLAAVYWAFWKFSAVFSFFFYGLMIKL